MRVSRIHVQNFRSIRDTEIQPTKFSLLVGKNNHGKTNVFEAINWFYTGKGDLPEIRFAGSDAIEDIEVVVEIEFSGIQAGVLNISNNDNRKKIKNVIGDHDLMRVRRTSADPKKQIYLSFRFREMGKTTHRCRCCL